MTTTRRDRTRSIKFDLNAEEIELVNRHVRLFRAIANKKRLDPDDRDGAAQEVALKICIEIRKGNYKPDKSLLTTFTCTAGPRHLDSLFKKSSRWTAKEVADEFLEELAEPEKEQASLEVEEYLSELPKTDRRLVRLRYGIGAPLLELDEIAAEEGIDREEVVKRLRAAITRLRRVYRGVEVNT